VTAPPSGTGAPGPTAPGRGDDGAADADAEGVDGAADADAEGVDGAADADAAGVDGAADADAAGVDLAGRTSDGDAQDRAPRSARVFVAVLFVLLLVPGLVGIEAWPLTRWRLFSLSRDADQTRWVLEAVDAGGDRRVVSLEELPLGYRHAEWPMAELPGASDERRDAVCLALAEAVGKVHPDTVELALSRDHTRLVERGGEWVTEHDIEPFHTCVPSTGRLFTTGVGP
jgi:hypothetical protein